LTVRGPLACVAKICVSAVALSLFVAIVNVAIVAPADTVTASVTLATTVLLLVSVTVRPPDGAGELSATDPVEFAVPTTVAGSRVSSDNVGGSTASVAERDAPPDAAEIVTTVARLTGLVDIVKLAVADPAATRPLTGTVAAAALVLLSVTTVPPVAAVELRITVPVDALPPGTVAGSSVTDETPGGMTVSCTLRVTPPDVPE